MSLASRLIMTMSVTLLMMVDVGAKPDVGMVYYYCGNADNPASDFQSVVDKVSRDLIKHTPQQNFNHYDEITEQALTGYGHSICKYDMSYEDCSTCLRVANTYRIKNCRAVFGSRTSLKGCYMRIEDYDFKWDAAEITSIF